jgi:CheY-like chemotaxis protein
MERLRILVVEDDFLIRMTLAEALADEGFEVLEAGTADEALAQFDGAGKIDLMMTDIQLPGGMDGQELAARVRAARPALPMIFMTGNPQQGIAQSPLELTIVKPYLPSEIGAAARRLTQAANKGS